MGAAPLGEGWDNVLWPVGTLQGEAVVLRVVRRTAARPLLERETTVLRLLAASEDALPMRVPAPLATTDEAVLVPWVAGRTAAEASDGIRTDTAHALARMLAAVHSLPAPRIDRNPVRGVPLATRAEAFSRDLELAPADEGMRRRARERWERGRAAPPWDRPDVLLHGDPHPGNVVVPDRGDDRRSALIDWGDTSLGDPAGDLGGMLMYDTTADVLTTYRARATWAGIEQDEVWEALVDRAWAWAARFALSLLTAYPEDHALGQSGRRLLST